MFAHLSNIDVFVVGNTIDKGDHIVQAGVFDPIKLTQTQHHRAFRFIDRIKGVKTGEQHRDNGHYGRYSAKATPRWSIRTAVAAFFIASEPLIEFLGDLLNEVVKIWRAIVFISIAITPRVLVVLIATWWFVPRHGLLRLYCSFYN